MSTNYKDMTNTLIGEYVFGFESDEPIYEDFISRKEFINRTGIYVSPTYFEVIHDEYKESDASIDDFLSTYEDDPMIQEVKMSGVFKYFADDDPINGLGTYDESHDPNIWEIVNELDMELYHKWIHSDKQIQELIGICERLISNNNNLVELINSIKSVVRGAKVS